jgi:hypothetical protein
MAPHFEIAPGNEGVKWWYTRSGAVWGCQVSQYRPVRVILVDAPGLPVRSNNFSVVPNNAVGFKGSIGFSNRRIIEFRTLSDGKALIEVVADLGTSETFSGDGRNLTPDGTIVANFEVKVDPLPATGPTLVRLNSPQTALNAPNVVGYRMTTTHSVPWSEGLTDMLGKVDRESLHVAIAAHGEPGEIAIGTRISMRNVDEFTSLRSTNVKVIWCGACSIAGDDSGKDFCRKIAMNAHAYMVAAGFPVDPSKHLSTGVVEWIQHSMPFFCDPAGKAIAQLDFTTLQSSLGFTVLPE